MNDNPVRCVLEGVPRIHFYAGEHALMWRLWDLAGGNGNPDAYRYFADPAVRRQMVPIIHQARNKDAQAADHIEKALR